MLVRCIGYCRAPCKCCFKDATSPLCGPLCVQSQFSCLSHLGLFPALWIGCFCVLVAAVLCFSVPCSPCPAWWRQWLPLRFSLPGISFVGAFAVRGLLEWALPQHIPWVVFSSHCGSAACSDLVSLADGTYQKPDILGATHNWDRISVYVQLRLN